MKRLRAGQRFGFEIRKDKPDYVVVVTLGGKRYQLGLTGDYLLKLAEYIAKEVE